VIALLALACGSDPGTPALGEAEPETAAQVFARLAAPGPHAVGYREDSAGWTDPDVGARDLRLAVWWPTDDTSGTEASYWHGAVAAGPGVWADASVAPGAHRVVVFSHGHQGYAENSSFLAEHLASWGFLVVAPDHTGNTALDGSERQTEIYLQRPGDVSAALSWALDPADPVRASADPSAPVLLGHSFGGYTVFAALGARFDPAALDGCAAATDDPFCATMTPALTARFAAGLGDPRWAAGVAMAPGDFGRFGDGAGDLGAPMFAIGGGLDPGGDASDYWSALQPADPAHRWLRIDGAGHQSFTDFSGLLESFEGLIDAEEGFRILDAYVLAAALAADGDATVASLLATFPGPAPGASLVGPAE